jgi:hypothetical protein
VLTSSPQPVPASANSTRSSDQPAFRHEARIAPPRLRRAVDLRRHGPAGAAPGGPEIDDRDAWLVQGGLEGVLREVLAGLISVSFSPGHLHNCVLVMFKRSADVRICQLHNCVLVIS